MRLPLRIVHPEQASHGWLRIDSTTSGIRQRSAARYPGRCADGVRAFRRPCEGIAERFRNPPGQADTRDSSTPVVEGWLMAAVARRRPRSYPVHSVPWATDPIVTDPIVADGAGMPPRNQDGSFLCRPCPQRHTDGSRHAYRGDHVPARRHAEHSDLVRIDMPLRGLEAHESHRPLGVFQRRATIPIRPRLAIDPITNAVVALRGPGDVTRLAPSIPAIVAETVPGGFVSGIATIEQQVEMSLVRERMLALLATFFACTEPGVYRPLRRDGVPRGPTHA